MNKGNRIAAFVFAAMAGILSVSTAEAQGLDIYIGNGDGGRYYDNDAPYYAQRRHRGCDPRDAIDTARSYGVMRARIASVDPRRLVVTGINRRGEPTFIYVANDSSCRRIRR